MLLTSNLDFAQLTYSVELGTMDISLGVLLSSFSLRAAADDLCV